MKQKQTIKTPTIHLNGSGPTTLFDGYLRAREAVIEAKHRLEHVEFHARDYYVQEAGAFVQAQKEHRARLQKLEEIEDELLVIVRAIKDQMDART